MRLIRLCDAAEIAGLSIATIRRLINSGELPVFRPSPRSIRIADVDLQAYLQRHRSAPRGETAVPAWR